MQETGAKVRRTTDAELFCLLTTDSYLPKDSPWKPPKKQN